MEPNNINTPKFFYDKIDTFTNQLPSILDDLKQNYFAYTKYPDNQDYSNAYSITRGSISQIMGELFTLKNSIHVLNDKLNTEISNLDAEIKFKKDLYTKNKRNSDQMVGKNKGSIELISDSKERYKFQYISNISMLIGIFLIIYLMISLFA